MVLKCYKLASFSSFYVKVLAFRPFSLETRVVKSLRLRSCHHVSMLCMFLRVVLILSSTSTYSAYGRNNKRVAVLYIDTLFPR